MVGRQPPRRGSKGGRGGTRGASNSRRWSSDSNPSNDQPDSVDIVHAFPKEILKARVPFFHGLLSSNMADAASGKTQLNELDLATTESLLDYIYTGTLIITESNVQNLLMGAVFLQMESVRDECVHFMGRRIQIENAIDLLRISYQIVDEKMKKIVLKFIDKNFVSFSLTETLLELTEDELVVILQRNYLRIDSEEQVFGALDLWMREHAEANREKLLKCIRCTRLSPTFLNEIIEKTDWMKENIECIALINDAKMFIKTKNGPCSFTTTARWRDEAHHLIAFMEMADEEWDGSRINFYNPITSLWSSVYTPTSPNNNSTVAVIDRQMYFIGGLIENADTEYRHRCLVFDTQIHQWNENGCRDPMIKKRSSATSCVLDGKLYVLGGSDGPLFWNDGECYDPYSDSWTLISPRKIDRHGFSAAYFNGYIYAAGGYNNIQLSENDKFDHPLRDVERYDPDSETWKTLNRLPIKGGITLVVCNSKLFASKCYFGNSHAITVTVAMYEPEADYWQTDGLPDFTLTNRNLMVFGLPAPVNLPKESFSTPYAGACVPVYVGNLSLETTENGLGHWLSQAGHVTHVHIETDSETGRSKGVGICEFADEASAQNAISQCDGVEYNGGSLRVEWLTTDLVQLSEAFT